MKIIRNNIIPFKGFSAINLFGVVFVRGKVPDYILTHEQIHTAQMKELLYVGFYLLYVLEWLFLLVKYRNAKKAYYNISFEKEAYKWECCNWYLYGRDHYAQWK
jgi:hypothetical protein